MPVPGDTIRRIRKSRGLTLQALADKIGTDTGNLSRLENGKQKYTETMLEAIAQGLDVEVPELFIARQDSSDYNVEGDRILLGSRIVPFVAGAQLGLDGFWHELEYPVGHGEEYLDYPTSDENAYALRVRGDSMRPRIKPGEFVIVEPNTQVQFGREVVVKTKDGRTMVKTLHSRRDGIIELTSVNEDHPPITFDERDVEFIHHVAGIANSALLRIRKDS
jgi:phage repressor protein C with HTH and peptisase S24 domain